MKIRKKKVFIFKNEAGDIAITRAYSKEEAVYKFEKHYPRVTGDKVNEADYNFHEIAIIKTREY